MNIGALVSYRGQAAKIIAAGGNYGNKVVVCCDNGDELKIRQKDFRFIHTDYQKPELTQSVKPDLSVLSDFYDQTLSLSELTQWLFDDNTPQNAWQTYLLIEDGLYFQWQKQGVFVRPKVQVDAIINRRRQQAIDEQKQSAFIKRIAQNTWCEADIEYLQEIEKVAFNQSRHAQILKALKQDNTPQTAHRLLLKIGYWQPQRHPYIERHKIKTAQAVEGITAVEEVMTANSTRVDLTHLNSYAIDNNATQDADDALSISAGRVWVHIADVASVIEPGSVLDENAQQMASTLYLPDQVINMLPDELMSSLPLAKNELSNTLSISFCINNEGVMNDIAIELSQIKVSQISYNGADKRLTTDADFKSLAAIAEQHRAFRIQQGAIKLDLPKVDINYNGECVTIKPSELTPAREMVAEFMVMAGRAAALFAQQNDIVLPFLSQPQSSCQWQPDLPLSQQFAMAKKMTKSAISAEPKPHAGLGLQAYVRITSPLRRYLDLLAQQQLLASITQAPLLTKKQLQQIVYHHNQVIARVRRVTRQAELHAKIQYLQQNPEMCFDGIVIDKTKQSVTFAVASLALLTDVTVSNANQFTLDSKHHLMVKKTDLVELIVEFRCA